MARSSAASIPADELAKVGDKDEDDLLERMPEDVGSRSDDDATTFRSEKVRGRLGDAEVSNSIVKPLFTVGEEVDGGAKPIEGDEGLADERELDDVKLVALVLLLLEPAELG